MDPRPPCFLGRLVQATGIYLCQSAFFLSCGSVTIIIYLNENGRCCVMGNVSQKPSKQIHATYSTLIPTTSAPFCLNSSMRSLKAKSSVGQTKVKSAG